MNTQCTYLRLLAATVAGMLLTAFSPNTSAGGWLPLMIKGTAAIESVVPIGGDGTVIIAEVVASETGWGSLWGNHTSVWTLVVEFDAATFAPIRAEGDILQTNADGSTLTFFTRSEGDRSFTMITGGTGRFELAIGGVKGEVVSNPDGTISYKDFGWISGVEPRRAAR